ncbi:ATP-dependent Clp protease ATP-binding subunit ClpX, partial [Pseudomonas sp. NPDC087803]
MTDTRNGEDNGKLLYCSFCGKRDHELSILFSGHLLFICYDLVVVCIVMI